MKLILRAVLAAALSTLLTTRSVASIEDCGDINSFRPVPYLAVAAELQFLPKEIAIARLREWADSGKYDEQVIILCRMLFEPREGHEFRRPKLGGPQFYSGTDMKDWPLEPITIIDDIPFLVVISYVVGGHPEEASSYLEYCVANAQWTARHYHAASKEEIEVSFEKLLNSRVFKRPLNEGQIGFIRRQMAPVAAVPATPIFIDAVTSNGKNIIMLNGQEIALQDLGEWLASIAKDFGGDDPVAIRFGSDVPVGFLFDIRQTASKTHRKVHLVFEDKKLGAKRKELSVSDSTLKWLDGPAFDIRQSPIK